MFAAPIQNTIYFRRREEIVKRSISWHEMDTRCCVLVMKAEWWKYHSVVCIDWRLGTKTMMKFFKIWGSDIAVMCLTFVGNNGVEVLFYASYRCALNCVLGLGIDKCVRSSG